MKKSFNNFRIKKPKAYKKRQKPEEKRPLQRYAKNLKQQDINVEGHVVIDEAGMRNRLIFITSILLTVVAVFLVIFQILRVNNLESLIKYTENRIDELTYIEEHIDEYNDLYAYDKLLSSGSLFVKNNTSIMAALRNLWSYRLLIGQEGDFHVITLDTLKGINDIPDLDDIVSAYGEDEIIVLRLEETLQKISIPYPIVFSGNVLPDVNDSIETFFLACEGEMTRENQQQNLLPKDVSLHNKRVYTEDDKQYVEIPQDRCNYIEYTFVKKAGEKVEFSLFFDLAERLFDDPSKNYRFSEEYGSLSNVRTPEFGASYIFTINMRSGL